MSDWKFETLREKPRTSDTPASSSSEAMSFGSIQWE